jgi:transcriptional regulator with XRE-family HTH domain
VAGLSAEKITQVEKLLSEGKLSRDQIAQITGVGQGTVSKIKAGYTVKPTSPKEELAQTEEVAGDTWTISIPKTRICTLDQLAEHCKIDLLVWEVDRFICNKWEVGAKDSNNEIQVTPLFQIKAFLKKKKHIVDARAEIEALKAEAKMHMLVPMPVVYGTQDSDNMLELLIPDLHAAKLAWKKETGFQNYDTSIAIETYDRAIDNLIQKASKHNISKIVLGVGNDVLQADNIQGTTFGGTKVDTDSRYRKSYKEVRMMFCRNIEKLRRIAPVEVKPVPGNPRYPVNFYPRGFPRVQVRELP